MAQDLESRRAALYLLERILDKGLTFDGAFTEGCARFPDLADRDRAFLRHLATTTLRRLGQINAMINFCTPKRLGPKQARLRHILQLGVAQLVYMNVPAHAAVDSSVRLVVQQKHPALNSQKAFVNAVLRRIDREKDDFLDKFSDPFLNLPRWLRDSWINRYGKAVSRRLVRALLEEPPLDISLKPELDPADWAQHLGGDILPTGGVRLKKAGPVEKLPGYADGVWWVQDLAAMLPARLLGAEAGQRVLDLCAAPGGKTLQSAARGCRVTAVDVSERRLRRLRDNLDRLGLNCDVVTSDAAAYRPERPFPYILLDAPCSSSGTLRRHPDMAWIKRPEDVHTLAALQARLLGAAVDMLAPGGVLVYCVCSLEAAEGPDQIKALLDRGVPVQRDRIRPEELPGLEAAIGPEGDVQTLPHLYPGGMDGFYICRLKRIS
ncbi:RsmB/NOP family class I SAM-dependent RNA methyltransferase [Luteithermobacter gelatinilyticus]|uniref:RsmB/NOP family class I SAM-dependent RNA methyltransferase n=1 Tax=Luteithermobacter gelatinilyticus TaxID=2582913 RepID=UPI0011062F34|nr:transcription antitermination factor NusB [Luteithermobacter gelatinilyticus]